MSLKQLSATAVAIVIGTCTFTAQAYNGGAYPTNNYWQAPNQSGFNTPPANNQAPPAYNNYQRPPPANYPAPQANRTAPPPPTGPYSGGAPAPRQNPYRGAPAPRQTPYRGAPAPRGPYNEPSAFSTPGYNQYYGNRRSRNRSSMPWGGGNSSMPWGGGNNSMPWSRGNNRSGNNKFWGRSGPSTWMSPSKDNWENSWDDMINAPSRMGDDMPGGWSAPEVTMPNPIDMGDQMQDNVRDLPDQMKDGNIGSDVTD